MAIKVPIVSEFNKTGLVQANTALAKFGVTSQTELKKAAAGFALLGAGAVAAFSKLDAGYDAIIVATGASGKALDGLKDDADAVARSVPNSFEDVGKAIGEVNTRLGLTGKPLQEVTRDFLNLSRITKTDVTTNIANVTRVFGDWGIAVEDQALAMDKLFKLTQTTGVGLDKLSTTVVQFGAPMRQLGFTFEESAALLAKFELEGVNTEAVMAGLKIGLGKMAAAGEAPAETLARVAEEIKNAGSAGEANSLAVQTFGTRAGPDLAAAIREGRFEIDEMVASLGGAEGALDDAAEATLSTNDRLKILSNQIIVAAAPAVELLEKVTSKLVQALGYLPQEVQGVVIVLGAVAVASKSARAGMLAFATSTKTAGASASAAKVQIAGMGTAIGVAVPVAMAAYIGHSWKSNQTTKKFTKTIQELGEASDEEIAGRLVHSAYQGAIATNSLENAMADIAVQSPDTLKRILELEKGSQGFTKALIASGKSADEAAEWLGRVETAAADAGIGMEDLTAEVEDGIDTAREFTRAQQLVEQSVEAAVRAYDGGRKSLTELRAEADAAREATRKLADQHMTAEEASWDWIEAQIQLNEKLADENATLIDVARQVNDTVRATDAMVMANAGLTEEALATAEGMATWTAGMKAAAAEMDGPGRRAVLEHIARVNGIPENKITEFKTYADPEAIRLLNVELAKLQEPRGVPYIPFSSGTIPKFGVNAYGASGGIVTKPTVALIGEAGPEAVIPLNKTPGSSPLPGGGSGGGGVTYNLVVNAGIGTNGPALGRYVVDAIKAFERNAGPGWREAS